MRVHRRFLLALVSPFAVLALPSITYAAGAPTSCAQKLVPPSGTSFTHRPVSALDVATLRDIGTPTVNSAFDPRQFTLSPDGRSIAFLVRQADPATNSYCQGIFVLGLAAGAHARLVDTGGELIREDIPNLRGVRMASGWPATILPLWSPDGRSLAYLRCEDGVTQIWRVGLDDGRSAAMTHETVDIDRFAWSADGRRLVFASRQPLVDWKARSREQGLQGFRYGKDFVPAAASEPLPPAGLGTKMIVLDLASGGRTIATAEDRQLLEPEGEAGLPAGATGFLRGPAGDSAWLAPELPSNPYSVIRLYMRRGAGEPIACRAASCTDYVTDFWWDEASDSILFLAASGWGRSKIALYRWRGGGAEPVQLFETSDLLAGCAYIGRRLLCGREAARDPRRLVWVDIKTGRQTVVFDANPEFLALQRGTVQRLTFENNLGLPAFADLVLPPDHKPGQRHPMVVVQYMSKGFLRGGVGDEYPVHALASRGFAVLSFNRPVHYAETVVDLGWTDRQQGVAVDTRDWADRRSVLSALLKAVDLAEATGTIDPSRVGITGLSDGSSAAIFALVNSKVFAAASLSTCCEDPKTLLLSFGPAWQANRYRVKYPAVAAQAPDFWRPVSLAMNVDNIPAPLLLQLSSDEYLSALETYATFTDAHRPIDMYVFPDEHHVKYQPAHRLAIYERNIDWFDFWLRDRSDPYPGKQGQYRIWKALREGQRNGYQRVEAAH